MPPSCHILSDKKKTTERSLESFCQGAAPIREGKSSPNPFLMDDALRVTAGRQHGDLEWSALGSGARPGLEVTEVGVLSRVPI